MEDVIRYNCSQYFKERIMKVCLQALHPAGKEHITESVGSTINGNVIVKQTFSHRASARHLDT